MNSVQQLWRTLWPEILRGSESAFDRLVQATYRRYRWYAYRATGRWDDADDLVQTAWWRLWRHRMSIRGSPSLWFYVTLKHLCADYHRRRARRLRIPPIFHSAGASERESTVESRLDFWRVWERVRDRLGEQQREVFWMKEILGMGDEEIARALAVTPSTVRSHLSLARKNLRRLVGPAHTPETEDDHDASG